MPSLTLAIPEDLKAKMNRFTEINWSEVARQAILEKTRTLEQMENILGKNTLSEKDVVELGKEIKRRVLGKHHRRAA